MINLEIFDQRRCNLGEGPIAVGDGNNEIMWVDIRGQKILSHNLLTNQTSEINTGEDIGFIIPTASGGFLRGTNSQMPQRTDIDPEPMRWNDAKVSPNGDLWLGSMTYAEKDPLGALYRLDHGTQSLKKMVGNLTISNGLAWSGDGQTMFLIDSAAHSLQAFDVTENSISNQRTVIRFPEEYGYADGMTIDSQGGLWIAFWNGFAVRCFDSKDKYREIERISTPVARTSSCTFAGEKLDQLIITTAHRNEDDNAQAGMTFIASPGVTGTPTRQFKA